MKLPAFASLFLLLFVILITSTAIRRTNKKMKNSMEEFYALEAKANATRKKPLDSLPYITIPSWLLALKVSSPQAIEALELLQALSSQKIVNFTGKSNTELKLTYGTANITVLTEYDQNYTQLVRCLQTLGEALWEEMRYEEARMVLEFAIATHSDVSKTYRLLAKIYQMEQTPEKIADLIQVAEELDSAMAPSILAFLKEEEGITRGANPSAKGDAVLTD